MFAVPNNFPDGEFAPRRKHTSDDIVNAALMQEVTERCLGRSAALFCDSLGLEENKLDTPGARYFASEFFGWLEKSYDGQFPSPWKVASSSRNGTAAFFGVAFNEHGRGVLRTDQFTALPKQIQGMEEVKSLLVMPPYEDFCSPVALVTMLRDNSRFDPAVQVMFSEAAFSDLEFSAKRIGQIVNPNTRQVGSPTMRIPQGSYLVAKAIESLEEQLGKNQVIVGLFQVRTLHRSDSAGMKHYLSLAVAVIEDVPLQEVDQSQSGILVPGHALAGSPKSSRIEAKYEYALDSHSMLRLTPVSMG